jgi:ribosomal protein S18 acetylase RimI-like enzyme
MRAAEFIIETQELDEIERLYSYDYTGGKDSLYDKTTGKVVKKLPGGSGLLYSIGNGRWGQEIKLWDPNNDSYKTPNPIRDPRETKEQFARRLSRWEQSQKAPGQLIGKLTISDASFPLPKAVQVDTITVDEDYRGIGLAKALYGIVLTIMKRPLLAGSSQTPGGRINWVSLSQIPGVQMKGYFSIDEGDLEPFEPDTDDDAWDKLHKKEHNKDVDKNIDTIMGKLGGQHIGRNRLGDDFFAFDVKPNTTGTELEAYVKTKLSKLYGNYESDAGLYAIWTGET